MSLKDSTYHKAFTIVELIVVIIIIGILSTIGIYSMIKIQQTQRDSSRQSQSQIIAEALEKYYNKNGEYPSPKALSNSDNSGASIASLLNVSSDVLVMPNASSNTTNSIVTSGNVSSNALLYTAISSTNNSICQNTVSGGCTSFTLKYLKEADGTVVTITSRHNSTETYTELVSAPSDPSVIITSDITATASTVDCATAGSAPEYAIRESVNDGAWSDYSSWSSAPSVINDTPSQGYKYEYQAEARCVIDNNYSSIIEGSVASRVEPINTPSVPTVWISASGDNTTWNWGSTSCPTGSSASYQYRTLTNVGGYTSTWYGPYSSINQRSLSTVYQGYYYTTEVQARCENNYTQSSWSNSNSASYTRPVDAPGQLSNFFFSVSSNRIDYIFSWTAPLCGPGTSAYHRYNSWIAPGYNWFWTSTGQAGWLFSSWSDMGYWSSSFDVNSVSGPYISGIPVRHTAQYICVNATTGMQSSWGPVYLSNIYYT
jgi:prepilin-type N-terminal cleavage/methylation domain-containing protein